MAFPKDKIAFLYVHQENSEVVFTSSGASTFCPIPAGDFMFKDLVASNCHLLPLKEKTRSQSPRMNTYWLPLLSVDEQSPPWRAYVCEMFSDGGYHGVVFTSAGPGVEYLAAILLNKGITARSPLLLPCTTNHEVAQLVTDKIVEVFEDHLLHFPKHDQWFTSGGKEKFAKQVLFHVLRNIRLELILPAFPAKSCNKAKVLSDRPDKGEELAIHSMKILADRVKDIYRPGAHFNVVSDGHVFSDLVGVDDEKVNVYGQIFRKMASSLYPGLVTFYGLDDFLFLQNHKNDEGVYKMIEGTTLNHPIKTALTTRAETARRVLMFLFGSEETSLRAEIDSLNDPETLALYSGFKRFMIEDLAEHETCLALPSKASRKKLCSKVGFCMIQRNRAYSKMVEWLFPIQLRISIHPHPNKGPKYGINVIHPSLVAMQRSSQEELFHTPTPWHNAVLELTDGKFMLLPSAAIQGIVAMTKGATMDRVAVLHYPDGRPSHYKLT